MTNKTNDKCCCDLNFPHFCWGAVRLSEGAGRLVFCEVETGLSPLSGLLNGSADVWAALSTSGMKTLRLPQGFRKLTIAPEGMGWNDVLMRGGKA